MLTEHEQRFIDYWSVQRTRKKQFLRKLSIGLPLGVGIALLLIINLLSGWYQKADMQIRSNSGIIIVILVAVVAIVVFITLFSARYKWDQNEQYFQELMNRKDQ